MLEEEDCLSPIIVKVFFVAMRKEVYGLFLLMVSYGQRAAVYVGGKPVGFTP
jgi:hypothetical protein